MPRNRRWLLSRRPQGVVVPEDFERRDEVFVPPVLAPGQILVQSQVFVCAPTLRTFLSAPGRAHRTFEVGDLIRGPVGAVVLASNHPRFAVGTKVTTFAAWEDYAVLDPDRSPIPIAIEPSDVTLEDALGILGLGSCTGYFGLLRLGRPEPGQTVVVSGAAGAIGHVVVQLAKIAGCRVVGIAGGPEKCRVLVDALGADAAVDYKAEDVRERLSALCPSGVDVYFDNVGGPLLDAVLDNIAKGARVVVCGQTSTYDRDGSAPGPRDMMTLIHRGVTLRGFSMTEFMSEANVARADLVRWRSEGRLRSLVDVRDGFDTLPTAFVGLFQGHSLGTLLVRVNASNPTASADDPSCGSTER